MKRLMLDLMFRLYAINKERIRKILASLIARLEGGEVHSETLRKVFLHYHGVEIGMYTHGGCFRMYQFDPDTRVGRYCSIAGNARVLRGNHPLDFKSTHGFFFDPALKFCATFLAKFSHLDIGNDVWLGDNSIIMPSVRRIGDGAVVAAGAVVNKDVPPYAVVAGNPARVVRYRFSPRKIEELLESHWWEKSIEELEGEKADFTRPLEPAAERTTPWDFFVEGGREG